MQTPSSGGSLKDPSISDLAIGRAPRCKVLLDNIDSRHRTVSGKAIHDEIQNLAMQAVKRGEIMLLLQNAEKCKQISS